MTIQEAYNKGLSDSESKICKVFDEILSGETSFMTNMNRTFPSDDLENLKNRLIQHVTRYREVHQQLLDVMDISKNDTVETFLVDMLDDTELIERLVNRSSEPNTEAPTKKRAAKKATKKVAKKNIIEK